MEFKKNDRVTVTIEDMGSDGEGIGKVDGFTLFIKDAVIGDQVEAKIIKSKKHYAYARLEKVLQPSPFRVEPKCCCRHYDFVMRKVLQLGRNQRDVTFK